MRQASNHPAVTKSKWIGALLITFAAATLASANVQIIAWTDTQPDESTTSQGLGADAVQSATNVNVTSSTGSQSGSSDASSGSAGGAGGSSGGTSDNGTDESSSSPPTTDQPAGAPLPPVGSPESPSASDNSPVANHPPASNPSGGPNSSTPSNDRPTGSDDVVGEVFHGDNNPPKSTIPTGGDLPGSSGPSDPVAYIPHSVVVKGYSPPPSESVDPLGASAIGAASAPEPNTLLTVGLCLSFAFAKSRRRRA